MNETLTKRREKLFSAHSAESNFSVSKRTSVCGKYSRRMSADPALQDYIPSSPDAAGNLPGMGGVCNLANLNLYHYSNNNPLKYKDPNGKWDEWALLDAFSTGNQFEFYGEVFNQMEQNLSAISGSMLSTMQDFGGKAITAGVQFMADNGATIAIACYASGNIGLGMVVDGITVACDISVAFNEYQETGDKAKFIASATKTVVATGIGMKAGTMARNSQGILKDSVFAKKVEGIIGDAVATGIAETLNLEVQAKTTQRNKAT